MVNVEAPTLQAAHLMNVEVGSEGELIAALREGLPASAFVALQQRLGMAATTLARALGIPPRTLTRRLKEGCFSPQESERLLRLARVLDAAELLFAERGDIRHYLTQAVPGFGGQTPLELLDTEVGTQRVIKQMMRLADGIIV